MNEERQRLIQDRQNREALQSKGEYPRDIWKVWGPYLTERQWGTVREDYSAGGDAWDTVTHDMARSKAYRWGEEGIGGISDCDQRLCLALAFWNEQDAILKERFFGLTGSEGNHGEDCKEYYYYLDSSPSHAYMKMLYKYPQQAYPYEQLVRENRSRGKLDAEFELVDAGVFDQDRYFDIFIEYARSAPDDIYLKITAWNRGEQAAPLHILPTLWYRNVWSWNRGPRPQMRYADGHVQLKEANLGDFHFYCDAQAPFLFCENDNNEARLYGKEDWKGYAKDGINDFVVQAKREAVNPEQKGTKTAAHCRSLVAPGQSFTVRARLTAKPAASADAALRDCDAVFAARLKETDEFYGDIQAHIPDPDLRLVQRQAFAGMLWSKQFYYYDVAQWLQGDPGTIAPPAERRRGRNAGWEHLNNADVLSMPDKWEYPWFAAWDLAFHCIPLSIVDPNFAKEQLTLLTREWYMHPNGQLPAYEWSFSDVNPPVHAWAALRVFQIERKIRGGDGDIDFLEGILHKLLLNFTWWVNRKDAEGNNIFEGGFLGLDNIGVFDRSKPLPTGGRIEQSDGTSWMAMYSLNLMRIAIEVAAHRPIYQDIATKFFEHFMYIASAMTSFGDQNSDLWNEEDEFYYDVLQKPDGQRIPLRIQSMVGFIPMFAVDILDAETLDRVPEFKRRLEWFLENRPELARLVASWSEPGQGQIRLFSLLKGHRLKRLLARMLDEDQFLAPNGIRALSKRHDSNPYVFVAGGESFTVRYTPGESDSGLFGGNSNWRGPIWMPVNYLIIESLQRLHHYYGDEFRVEFPPDSGKTISLAEAAHEIGRRLTNIFLRGPDGRRPVFGDVKKFQEDKHFRDYLNFYEYFHGDTGRGVGASHQTGWTGLIAKIIQPRGGAR